MNQKNVEYLLDQLKYTGFGEGLEADLKRKIEDGKNEFHLQKAVRYGDDYVSAILNFSKSKQSDMYFFNSYEMKFWKQDNPEKLEQIFYINKGNNITFKEAYNLMDGRSVNKDLTNKDGQVYNAWLQLDFKQSNDNGNFKMKQFHQNYGYDLEASLDKHPIKELANDSYKGDLIESLKKGNRQSVTFLNDGAEEKHSIEANPRFKTISIYDSTMRRIDNRQSKTERNAEGESLSSKSEVKKERQTAEDDGPEMPQAAKRKRRRQSLG